MASLLTAPELFWRRTMIPWLKGYNSYVGAILLGLIGMLMTKGTISVEMAGYLASVIGPYFGISLRAGMKK